MKIKNIQRLLFLALLLASLPLSAQEALTRKESVANRLYERSLQMGGNWQNPSTRFNHLWMAYQIDSTQPEVLDQLGELLIYTDVKRGLDTMEEGYRYSGYDHQAGSKLLRIAGNFEDWERAERISQKLLEKRPNDKMLRQLLVTTYENSGQLEKALSIVRGFEGSDRDVAVVVKEAQLLRKLGQMDEAEQLLEKHLEENPNDTMVAILLISMYADQQKMDKMNSLFEKTQASDPGSADLSNVYITINAMKGNNEAVKAEILRFAELEGSDPITVQSLLTSARSNSNDLTKLLPTLIKTELELQQIYSEEDRFALAAANDHLLLSDTIQAEKIFSQLVQKGTELPSPYYYFVEKYAKVEDVEQLDQVTTQGLKSIPHDGLLNLYSALVALNKEDSITFNKRVDHAIEVVEEGDPMYGQIALIKADLIQDDDWTTATQFYEKAVAAGIPTAYNNYAYGMTKHGTPEDLNRAEEMARKAVQYDSENGSFLDTYAWILYLKKAYPLAKIYMERAISKEEEPDPLYYEHYSDILFALGEYEEALQALRKALEAGGDVPTIEKKIENIVHERDQKSIEKDETKE